MVTTDSTSDNTDKVNVAGWENRKRRCCRCSDGPIQGEDQWVGAGQWPQHMTHPPTGATVHLPLIFLQYGVSRARRLVPAILDCRKDY